MSDKVWRAKSDGMTFDIWEEDEWDKEYARAWIDSGKEYDGEMWYGRDIPPCRYSTVVEADRPDLPHEDMGTEEWSFETYFPTLRAAKAHAQKGLDELCARHNIKTKKLKWEKVQ